MSGKRLKQASEIIGVIERGDLNHDLTNEIEKVLKALQEQAPPKGKIKGSVSLKLGFTVSANSVELDSVIDSKVPKRPRQTSLYFLTQDAELSTEHPQQEAMEFSEPRVVRNRDRAAGE